MVPQLLGDLHAYVLCILIGSLSYCYAYENTKCHDNNNIYKSVTYD